LLQARRANNHRVAFYELRVVKKPTECCVFDLKPMTGWTRSCTIHRVFEARHRVQERLPPLRACVV
jgi:hypothetical protein